MKRGDIIVNGSGTAYEIVSERHRDTKWKSDGFRCLKLYTNFGDGFGTTHFVPDYLLSSYRVVVPGQWHDIPDGAQEKWTWEFSANGNGMPARFARKYRSKEVND